MSDVHVVDALAGYTRSYLLPLLFDLEDKREKSFDIGWWNIVAVRALDKGFPFQIQDSDEAGHSGLADDEEEGEMAVILSSATQMLFPRSHQRLSRPFELPHRDSLQPSHVRDLYSGMFQRVFEFFSVSNILTPAPRLVQCSSDLWSLLRSRYIIPTPTFPDYPCKVLRGH